jgi:hypothetical protein
MMMQTIMQVTMLVQAMMQTIGDGGVHDNTSIFSNESYKERPWVCLDITCESPSLFSWHLISFQFVPTYV